MYIDESDVDVRVGYYVATLPLKVVAHQRLDVEKIET